MNEQHDTAPRFVLFGGAQAQILDRAPAVLAEDSFLWIDQVAGDARQWAALVARLCGVSVFEDHLNDTENDAHPPYFDSTSRYEMLILRALKNPSASISSERPASLDGAQTQALACLLFERCLVTISGSPLPLLENLRKRLIEARGARVPSGPTDLMLRIADLIVDQYLALRQPLADQIERWQSRLLGPAQGSFDWPVLLDARLALQRIGIVCEAQSDALQAWLDERIDGEVTLDERLQVRANDVLEHLQRVTGLVRRIESAIESTVQLHFSATAHRTNEVMRVLTVLTAVFLPLTLITGIFGMNFEQIPGIHWPGGFWLTILAMAMIAAVLIFLFRKRRYLERRASR